MKYVGHLLKRYLTISHYFYSLAVLALSACWLDILFWWLLCISRLLTKRDSTIADTGESWAIGSRSAIALRALQLHCALKWCAPLQPTYGSHTYIGCQKKTVCVAKWVALFTTWQDTLGVTVIQLCWQLGPVDSKCRNLYKGVRRCPKTLPLVIQGVFF